MFWIGWRLAAGFAISALTLVAAAYFVNYRLAMWLWTHDYRIVQNLLFDEFEPRVWRIIGIGFCLGLLLPNLKFPNWLGKPLLGLTIGMLIGVLLMFLLDSVLTEWAVNHVYAPYGNPAFSGDNRYIRPEPYQKGYPSMFGAMWLHGLVMGGGAGLFVGAGQVIQHRARWLAFAVAGLISAISLVQAYRYDAACMHAYIVYHTERLSKP